MAVRVQPQFDIAWRFSILADLSYKTKGWVFGNPYLDEKFTFRLGFGINTRNWSSDNGLRTKCRVNVVFL
jgi:hypothetical protein